MKALAILCNILLLGFTGLVLAAEGLSPEPAYIVLTALLLLTLLFTIFVLARTRAAGSNVLRRAAAACNVVLLAAICWAIVDQYPHPEEAGFIPYVVLALLVPLLNTWVLLRAGSVQKKRTRQVKAAASQL